VPTVLQTYLTTISFSPALKARKTDAAESEAPGPQSFPSLGSACARHRQLTARTACRDASGTRAISTTFPSPGRYTPRRIGDPLSSPTE
jgi:hypothetical protein